MATEEKDKDLSAELMDQSREQKAKANDYALTDEESARGENRQKQRGAEDRAEEAGEAGREQAKKRSADTDEGAARGEREDKLQRGDAGVVQERRRVDPDLGAEELKKDRAVESDTSAHAEQRTKAEAVNIDTEARARMEEQEKAIGEDKMKADDTSAARSESGQKASAEQSTKRYGSATSSGEAEGEGAAGPRVPKVI